MQESSKKNSLITNVTPPFDSSKTAKPVLAIKTATKEPSFWLKIGRGSRTTPLTKGDYAKIFLTDDTIQKVYERKDLDKILAGAIRERWINKLYQKCIKEDDYKQIIILGSGFDIKPFKKNSLNQFGKTNASLYSTVRFWEIDRAVILDEKERIFKENNLDKNASYIKADYVKDDIIEMLHNEGVNFSAPTLIIWEGNWMYLENEEVDKTFKTLKDSFDHFIITFDYCSQSLVDNTNTVRPLWQGHKLGIDDICHFAEQHGLTVVANQTTDNLAKEYDVDNSPPEEFSQYSVCSLQKC
ncbi:MAG: class I SAM-dependent methyltransferase [Gammaproteobacteria bacterium]|nr:class I SAM-dependent methyltransferase [Gammaproteobacteria bacterium]